MRPTLLIALLLACSAVTQASEPLQKSIDQLRYAIGDWHVVTTFIDVEDGTTRSVDGTYTFEWVIEDRVVAGRSEIPSLQRTSAILFYVAPSDNKIEMVSVGADGNLWIMTGPLGGETRYTQEFENAGGETAQLRFTRFNVSDSQFESKMEITTDGGKTWQQANHQLFERAHVAG